MNITMNDRLEFAHDENNPKEWFLHKTADKQGFPLQFNRGGTRLRNKYICKTILDIAKVKGTPPSGNDNHTSGCFGCTSPSASNSDDFSYDDIRYATDDVCIGSRSKR